MKPVTRSFYEMAIQRTIEQIAANLDGALDLECLARGAGLSPFHFHRVFRGMVGETPLELIRRLRMERAAWRLARDNGGSGGITDIAFDAGYETHEAFTRAFRACYSTSPTGFRQRKHPRIEIVATCGVHYNAHGRVPAFIPRNSGGDTMEVEIKEMPELQLIPPRYGRYQFGLGSPRARRRAVQRCAGSFWHAKNLGDHGPDRALFARRADTGRL